MMMLKAVLFDLDDTLLGNSIDRFLPPYFELLGDYAAQRMGKDHFLDALSKATRALVTNTDPAISNRDVFWQSFAEQTGLEPASLEAFFDQFYRDDFHKLKHLTAERPVAAELLRLCAAQGLLIVVATNPMFPLAAVEARLAWAGLPVNENPFALVTTYENMHATKPHRAYYEEILGKIACQPQEALMVGDDWQRDIEPAHAAGLFTYWVQLPGTSPPDATLPTAYGTLDHLLHLMRTGWLQRLPQTSEGAPR